MISTFIDEVGYLNLRPEQTNTFFKLRDERYRRKATRLTTNLEHELNSLHGLCSSVDPANKRNRTLMRIYISPPQ